MEPDETGSKVQIYPKGIKKAFAEMCSMFFRNTQVAHKRRINPYSKGNAVLQTIIWSGHRQQKSNGYYFPRKVLPFRGFFYIKNT